MRRDYITIGERKYRVEANWNAIVAFLEASGQNNMQALLDLKNIKPTDVAGLMAAAINEGEALEGRESALTAKDIGRMEGSMEAISEFLTIFSRQMSPAGNPPAAEGKKE